LTLASFSLVKGPDQNAYMLPVLQKRVRQRPRSRCFGFVVYYLHRSAVFQIACRLGALILMIRYGTLVRFGLPFDRKFRYACLVPFINDPREVLPEFRIEVRLDTREILKRFKISTAVETGLVK
jgi:hypothetical protein